MGRVLVSCTDFKAILTPAQETSKRTFEIGTLNFKQEDLSDLISALLKILKLFSWQCIRNVVH